MATSAAGSLQSTESLFAENHEPFFNTIDPQATLAVHCGNGFDAGFSPYQRSRLSR
jgi:hypothetical protein